ncbi:ATP-binding protein [Carnobacterium maltaromaticum]|uniref:ATP-binding protein n=1 Tax=Carnobacterium maltaromaticum TaxID=2751 RepID=A0AAW9JSJ9_CARML|nr:ATP-binding protein [Carnobacterium maltaromaticum]MDZ5758588.1 ATP-binding protein [Carnobacterium maltaromaticum]
MLVNFSVDNFKLFNSIDFSMKANASISHLKENYVKNGNRKILKSAVIFGPNNSGKSSFIEAIIAMKDIVNGKKLEQIHMMPMMTKKNKNRIIKFKISFYTKKIFYEFGFSVDFFNKKILNEYLKKGNRFVYKFEKNEIGKVQTGYEDYFDFLKIFKSDTSLYLSFLKKSENEFMFPEAFDVYSQFEKIEFINASTKLFPHKSIELLENGNDKFINGIMKNSDLSIEKLEFDKKTLETLMNHEDDLDVKLGLKKYFSIKSKHKYKNSDAMLSMPFTIMESLGTERLFAFAGEIYYAIKEGKILIVDEIDNSFHTIITRNLINLFHSAEHTEGQLITTTHDLLLLENKYLFRKDQIWFTEKIDAEGYLYSLDDFTSESGGVRSSKSNLLKKYLENQFGGLPNVDIVDVLDNLQNGDNHGS